jgi:hypothetical protein
MARTKHNIKPHKNRSTRSGKWTTAEEHALLQSWLTKVVVIFSLAWISVTLFHCLYAGQWESFQQLWDKADPLLMFVLGLAFRRKS